MASPVIASSTTQFDTTATTSRTIAYPSGVVAGDWVLLLVSVGSTTGFTDPADFTSVFNKLTTTHRCAAYIRKAAGSLSGNITLATAANIKLSAVCMRLTGVDATTAISAISTWEKEEPETGAIICPLAYADTDDTLILRVGTADGNKGYTSPAGHTEVANLNDSVSHNTGGSLAVAYVDQASAGHAAPATFTSTVSSEEVFGATIVIQSDGSSPTHPAQPVVHSVCVVNSNAAVGQSVTVDVPYGTVDNDLLLLMHSSDTASVLSLPVAFTSIQNTSSGTGIYGEIAYRVASSEPASYTTTLTTGANRQGALMRIVGAATSSPISASSVATGTSTSADASTITPANDNCLLIYGAVNDDDDMPQNTAPSGYTAICGYSSIEGNDSGLSLSFKTQTTATATGTVSLALDLSEEWIAFNVAIKAGGATEHIITCDASSFSLSAQAAGISTQRVVICGAGSLSLSGQDVGLTAERVVICGAGSLSLSGQDVGFTAERVIECGTGAISLSGQAVGVSYQRTIFCGVGEITLSGQDVGASLQRTIVCEGSSLGLSGQGATITVVPANEDSPNYWLLFVRRKSRR